MPDPLWINASAGAPAYDAAELRRGFAMLLTQAVATRFGARSGVHPAGANAVSLSGTTINVLDTKAVVYPGLSSLAGPYLVQVPAKTHTLTAADVTNPRKDIVVLRVWDDTEDLSGLRNADTAYIVGTPAPSPAEPAVPSGAFRLATIDVPANNTAGSVLTYNAPYTVASGGIVPVRTDTELPGASGGVYDGMARWRQDTNELQVHSGGSTWETVGSVAGHADSVNPPACRVYRTGNQLAAHATTVFIIFNNERFDTANMHSTVSNMTRITFPKAGVYLVGGGIRYEAAADYTILHIIIRKNGVQQIAHDSIVTPQPSVNQARYMTVNTVYKFAANDYVEIGFNQQNGASAQRTVETVDEESLEGWATYLGSGN